MQRLKFRQPRGFKRDRRAVTAIEYALIAALIGVGIVAAVIQLGGNASNTFNTVSNVLPSASTSNTTTSNTTTSNNGGTTGNGTGDTAGLQSGYSPFSEDPTPFQATPSVIASNNLPNSVENDTLQKVQAEIGGDESLDIADLTTGDVYNSSGQICSSNTSSGC